MPKRDKGQTTYHWVLPPGSRDEGGDCTRMAYAALQLVARKYNRSTFWDQMESTLGQSSVPTLTPVPRRRGSWLGKD
jgi:hypothetical protein